MPVAASGAEKGASAVHLFDHTLSSAAGLPATEGRTFERLPRIHLGGADEHGPKGFAQDVEQEADPAATMVEDQPVPIGVAPGTGDSPVAQPVAQEPGTAGRGSSGDGMGTDRDGNLMSAPGPEAAAARPPANPSHVTDGGEAPAAEPQPEGSAESVPAAADARLEDRGAHTDPGTSAEPSARPRLPGTEPEGETPLDASPIADTSSAALNGISDLQPAPSGDVTAAANPDLPPAGPDLPPVNGSDPSSMSEGLSPEALGDADPEAHEAAASLRAAMEQHVAEIEQEGQALSQGMGQTAAQKKHQAHEEARAQTEAVRAHVAQQRSAIIAHTAQQRAGTATSVQAYEQQARTASESAAQSVAADLNAKKTSIGQAGQTQAAAVRQAGQAEAQRASSQNAGRAQIQQAAGGGYGGGDKGRAQTQAAQRVADKGVAALERPTPAIAADARSASAGAASRLAATAQRVSAQLAGQVQPATAALRQPAVRLAGALGQLRNAVSSQFDRIRDRVLGGLASRQSDAERGFAAQARAASVQMDQQAHDGQGQVRQAVRGAISALRTRTTALLQQAQRVRDPRVPGVLRQAQQSLAGGKAQYVGSLRQGTQGLGASLDRQLGMLRSGFAQGAQQVRAGIGTLLGQAQTSQQELRMRATTHTQQGTAETQVAIHHVAAGTRAQASQIAQRTSRDLSQAAAQSQIAIGQGVTTAMQQNRDHVAGQVGVQARQAADEVAQDHDGFLAGVANAIGSVLGGIWDAVKAVVSAVADVVLDVFLYVSGAILQVVSNLLGGLLDPLLDLVPSAAFHAGRDLGDKISFVLGIVAIIAGLLVIASAITITGGFGLVAAGTGGAALVATPVVIVVDGALVLVGGVLIAAGAILMMSSGGTPGNNQAQNRQFKGAVREGERQIGRRLTKDEIRRVHDAISGQNYGYHEIVELIVEMFGR